MGSAALRSGEAAPVGCAVEERVRALVAEHLGVDREALARDVSLTDDLAADSLDLLELGVVLEASFGIVVPLRTIDQVRTYGDLVDAVRALLDHRRPADGIAPEFLWARVIPAAAREGDLRRAGPFTPYARELIVEDALRAGRGARLELTLPAATDDATLATIHEWFGRLVECGIELSIRRLVA
jgi:acyl carrier protein